MIVKIAVINQHAENWGDEAAFLGFTSSLKNLNVDINHVVINSSHYPCTGYTASSDASVHPLRYCNFWDKLLFYFQGKYQLKVYSHKNFQI